MGTNWTLHFYHSYTKSNPLPHPWQTPLKWRHWKWGFGMNVKVRKLAFCLSMSYNPKTYCVWISFLYFPSHKPVFLYMITFVFDGFNTPKFARPRSLSGGSRLCFWVNSVISCVLLKTCLEMGAGKFTSSHVFINKKVLYNYDAMEYRLKIISIEYLKILTRIFWMDFKNLPLL